MDLDDAAGVEALGKALEQAQGRLEEVQEKVKQMTPTWVKEG
jgi:chromosome segregation ATPase